MKKKLLRDQTAQLIWPRHHLQIIKRFNRANNTTYFAAASLMKKKLLRDQTDKLILPQH
jgi:hypothetical protein